ncbi:MAG: Spi family protease inhibitor [Bacteroidales bacterium]|nr:Spi family protease inhibitor [Bacteroidales bacterium]
MQKTFRLAICAVLVLFYSSICGFSKTVDRNSALKVADAFFNGRKSLSEVQHKWTVKDGGQPAFYIFKGDGGGFVIVASDDNGPPAKPCVYKM